MRAHFQALLHEITANRTACAAAALFVLFVLPTCLLLAVLVPPGEVVDEAAHVSRADSLLSGEIIGFRRTEIQHGKTITQSGFDCNPALLTVAALFSGVPPGDMAKKKLRPGDIVRLQAVTWAQETVFVDSPGAAIYMPAFYVPPATAIGLARALRLSPYQAFGLARILNVFCFVGLGTCALLIATRGRVLLFAVLCLPMTLSLAASCNPDGLLIATCALAFALITRAAAPRGRAYWTAALLLAIVIAVKIPYFPLALLLLIPCLERNGFHYTRRLLLGLRMVILTILPGVLWLSIAMHHTAIPMRYAPYHPGYLWPGKHDTTFDSTDAAEQAKVFLHRPLYPIVLPMRAVRILWRSLEEQMIGKFGWVEFDLPARMYPLWEFALAFAILSEFFEGRTNPRSASPKSAIVGSIAVFAALCAVCDAAYLAWTPVGLPGIAGLQGRYLLPLLAALAVFIPSIRVGWGPKLKTILAVPAFALAASGIVVLPSLMVITYYLR